MTLYLINSVINYMLKYIIIKCSNNVQWHYHPPISPFENFHVNLNP